MAVQRVLQPALGPALHLEWRFRLGHRLPVQAGGEPLAQLGIAIAGLGPGETREDALVAFPQIRAVDHRRQGGGGDSQGGSKAGLDGRQAGGGPFQGAAVDVGGVPVLAGQVLPQAQALLLPQGAEGGGLPPLHAALLVTQGLAMADQQ